MSASQLSSGVEADGARIAANLFQSLVRGVHPASFDSIAMTDAPSALAPADDEDEELEVIDESSDGSAQVLYCAKRRVIHSSGLLHSELCPWPW